MLRVANFVFIVALVALAIAANAQQAIKGNFVERREAWEHGHLKGSFYYYYNATHPNMSRLRLDYTFDYLEGQVITTMYYYEDGAKYSMNGTNQCKAFKTTEIPDPWWNVDNLFDQAVDPESNGMYWFTRKTEQGGSTPQVKRILMKSVSAPEDDYLSIIEFNDGRTLSFTDVKVDGSLTVDSETFLVPSACPRPSCQAYADIVVALDSSGSVTVARWMEMVEFVSNLFDSLTFGEEGVQAAVVHYGGRDNGSPPETSRYNVSTDALNTTTCNGKGEATNRFWKDYKFDGRQLFPDDDQNSYRTGNYLAIGGNVLKPTVTTNSTYLKEAMVKSIKKTSNLKDINWHKYRGTCQALGLKLAEWIFDNSPRSERTNKPARIVIVVTDGADKFASMARGNITELENEYNATVIEVGIGLLCQFDKDLLYNISSTLPDGSKAFVDAQFGSLNGVLDQVFNPICYSNFSSECSVECKGFCGAGECLCPDCDVSSNICKHFSCNVSVGYSEGCIELDVEPTAEQKNTSCLYHYCSPDANDGHGEWIDTHELCTTLKNEYPGTCRAVDCDEAKYGGCPTKDDINKNLNNAPCSKFEVNTCEKWECTPLDEEPMDAETGCRLKTNYTDICVKSLGKKSSCFVCDPASSDCNNMMVDTCKLKNNACYTYACTEMPNGEYECVESKRTEMVNVENNTCFTYTCDINDPDATWKEIPKNCASLYEGDKRCKNIHCDLSVEESGEGFPEGTTGCIVEKTCESECTDVKIAECSEKGESRNDRCVLDMCCVQHTGEGDSDYELICASDLGNAQTEECKEQIVNCLHEDSPSAKEALRLNQLNSKECWTPVCSEHECTVMQVELPDELEAKRTKCEAPICYKKEDGSWDWKMNETEEQWGCVSDECFIRTCDPKDGCQQVENCESRNNDCYDYKCTEDKKCVVALDKTLTFVDAECLKETCENGTKVSHVSDCIHPTSKCYVGTCVKGTCQYTPTEHGNDICQEYTCDDATGIWHETPKCDDGLYCTIDQCVNYGRWHECRNKPIDCSASLDMEGFSCFVPYCKEYPSLSDYRCVRKLKPHTLVDICGNCITEEVAVEEDGEEGEGKEQSSESSAGFVDCTNSPPEPMYVETAAAATIALIIVGAVIAGSAVAASSVIGTKTLIARARAMNNQVATSNPLFEGAETELTNPAFIG